MAALIFSPLASWVLLGIVLAIAIAKGLKFDVKTATDITAGQLSTILGKHLDR